MTLLAHPEALPERTRIAAGALRPLAESLAADLRPVVERDLFIPPEKARLSRDGGRCPRHGVLLEFDPFSPRRHRCPQCGDIFEDETHYRWWIMSYQLWLAERAVHGAVLGALRNDAAARALAERIIAGYAERYLEYPNADNVLGPTRLFFSTYLESIWLLQLCVAIDLLEASGGSGTLGAELRERVIRPSAALIRSYDEGASNRQSWNNAALLAAALLLDAPDEAEHIVWSRSGIAGQLGSALLADGTWYEGENYHLFAHRGLWYGVQMAERAGLALGPALTSRFEAGFGAPFVGVLPDLTLPSRRDSPYAISVRQWRFAELCELGLARRADDPVLSSVLGRLYGDDVPRRDTGRAASAAEAERNVPGSALTRADLGWRSLLFAREKLPPLSGEPPRSAILDDQGYAVFRRGGAGDVYIALDYGHSGGGHGHPDRLNLQLAQGDVRWLDDLGTGSYVDPSLHWYRSTLAHNAPLVDGHSQARVHGVLRAYEETKAGGWVSAEVSGIAPGVDVARTLVAMPGYLVDVVEWEAGDAAVVDLPVHLDAETVGAALWTAAAPWGGTGLEDGFDFLRDPERRVGGDDGIVRWSASREERRIDAWVAVDGEHEWWRAVAPGPPGRSPARFYWSRARGTRGAVRAVIDWSGSVTGVRVEGEAVIVEHLGGEVDVHQRSASGWRVERRGAAGGGLLELGGIRATPMSVASSASSSVDATDIGVAGALTRAVDALVRGGVPAPPAMRRQIPALAPRDDHPLVGALEIPLGEPHYRRSEQSWQEAGSPTAVVRVGGTAQSVVVEAEVEKPGGGIFAPPRARNDLDNEHPDTNSDGIQLYVAPATDPVGSGWLLVPEAPGGGVRVTPIGDGRGSLPLRCRWAATPRGYRVRCELPVSAEMRRAGLDLDLIVNEIAPGRERRRGQLVLSGGEGEWIYLRGDRQSRDRYLPFSLPVDAG